MSVWKFIPISLFLCFPIYTHAAEFNTFTVITEDTVWTQAESPYVLQDFVEVRLDPGASLTMEPGVVVKFGHRSDLKVLGNFSAVGTQAQPIIFTSLKNDAVLGDTNADGSSTFPSAGDSWGIHLGDYRSSENISVEMDYVESSFMGEGIVIERASAEISNLTIATSSWGVYTFLGTTDIDNFSAANIDRSALILDTVDASVVHATVSDNSGDAIEVYHSTVSLDDIVLRDVEKTGIGIYIDSVVDITNLSSGQPVFSRSNVVDVFESSVVMDDLTILNSAYNDAISIFNGHATITNATLIGGLNSAIYADSSGNTDMVRVHLEDVHIEGFLEEAIEMYSGKLSIKDSTIKDNLVGISSYFGNPSSSFTMENSSIVGNVFAGVVDYGSLVLPNIQRNWWGDPTGPYHSSENPFGLGDEVEGNFVFSNWLTAPPGEEEVSEIDPLLLEYMPVLYMHPDEDYLPMNVEAFVEGSAIWDDRGILTDKTLVAAGDGNDASLEFIATTTDTENWYIQFSGEGSKEFDLARAKTRYDALIADEKATTSVYVHKMEDSFTDEQGDVHEFIVLQYWYFYAMNNWKEQGGFNDHEGDWESVFVFLDKATHEPRYVAYSAHHNDGTPNGITQYDSVKRNWDSSDVVFDEGQVTSFVSLGSHANYPNNGNGGIHDAKSSNDVTSNQGLHLKSVLFSLQNLSQDEPLNWFNLYKGKWGVDTSDLFGSASGPQGPNYIDVGGTMRFHNPVAWAGLDKVSKITVEAPESNFSFPRSGVELQFSDPLETGTQLSVDPHEELVSFGTNASSINFLPRFWDFQSNLENETFDVTATLSYTDEQLAQWEVDEEFMQVYFYNEPDNLWEPVSSHVLSTTNHIDFTISHFSYYAIGSPVLIPVDDQIKAKAHSGKYYKHSNTQEVKVVLQEKKGHFPDDLRVVFHDLSDSGAQLLEAGGIIASGDYYVDIQIDSVKNPKKVKLLSFLFTLPGEELLSLQAHKKSNNEFKKIRFGIDLYNIF